MSGTHVAALGSLMSARAVSPDRAAGGAEAEPASMAPTMCVITHANCGFHGAASARRLIVFNILRLITKPTGSIR